MASIFRRKRKKNGRTVSATKYTCQFVDPTTGKTCRVPGFTDRGESRRLAQSLESGQTTADHRQHRKTPLGEHVKAFIRHLQAQNDCAKYVKVTATRIKAVIDGCRFTTLRCINLPDVEHWLAEQRTAKAFGIKTSNEYASVVRQWLAWLVDNGRAETNPLTRFKKLTDTDEKRERRALSSDEFSHLIATTLTAPTYREISGLDRAMLYLVSAFTGLRASECASLTAESFELVTGIVVVEAAHSKRRRLDRQPLPPDLVERLRAWLPGRSGALWTGKWEHDAARMLRSDLALAKIPYVDSAGKVLDFHALGRHTFCTNLALGNVPPTVARNLARHSTIELTLGTYAHVRDSDAMAGLGKLPAVPSLTRKASHGNVTQSDGLAQIGTPLDPRSKPESDGLRPRNGYFLHSTPVCYGSSENPRGRLETYPTACLLPPSNLPGYNLAGSQRQ